MKKLVALLLVSMMATVAFAGLDPDTDSMGIYFDLGGNTVCTTAPVFTPFNVYLLLMNPAGPTNGFECTISATGAPVFVLSTDLGAGALDVDGSANGFAVGAAAPYPFQPAMKLATFSYMVQAPTALEFRLGAATVPSMAGGVPVVTGDGFLRRCVITTADTSLPVAVVNGACNVVGEEVNSFGSVKSLFR